MGQHFTYDDRLKLQQLLSTEKLNATEIGNILGKNRTSVVREIKRHREYKPYHIRLNLCVYRHICNIAKKCTYTCYYKKSCTTCYKCNENCQSFVLETCNTVSKFPYVCNGCNRVQCRYGRWIYNAKKAQLKSEEDLSASRQGISISDDDLAIINDMISPLLAKGIAPAVAYQKHADQMPVSLKTVYSYVNNGILDAKNTDLHRKLRRPLRKKTGPILRVDKKCHVNRTYNDYLIYLENNPGKTVCQMDSVLGGTGGKCVLSLLFTNCDLQLYYLRDANNAKTVTECFTALRSTLGEDFTKLFQVILGDRGSEFTDPLHIEADPDTGEINCNVFYCEPMQSNQKSNCERNHELFRYIIPKGTSFKDLTQEDMNLIMNTVNSYPREKWNFKSPIELFENIYGKEILKKLGLEKIPVENLILKPELIKK